MLASAAMHDPTLANNTMRAAFAAATALHVCVLFFFFVLKLVIVGASCTHVGMRRLCQLLRRARSLLGLYVIAGDTRQRY
jgi:hypothetical protein